MFAQLIHNLNNGGCEKERALGKDSRDRLASFYELNADTIQLMTVHLLYKYITENKTDSEKVEVYQKALNDIGVYMSETLKESKLTEKEL